MSDIYESTETREETMRDDLVELLAWLKDEVMTAPTSVIESGEDGKKKKSSEFSQRVDAYDKFYKLYLADTGQEFDHYIQDTDRERKNCEYLEDTDHKNKELKLKERELDIKESSARESGRWWNKPLVQTAMICGTTLIVNGIALRMNASEAPLKNIFERWMIRPRM